MTEDARTQRRSATCAFLATSFGFGPVSKAVTIAQELKAQAPQWEAHFFGAGIDYDYAAKSRAFDRIAKIDVDSPGELFELLPQFASYSAVFSILNLALLRLWKKGLPPLYFVDSLAWMWPTLPIGIENVTAYYVQDYLVSPKRVQAWAASSPLVLVAPIESASRVTHVPMPRRSKQLLVNFSGCSNPLASPGLYQLYVEVLSAAILDAASNRYERVIFCCNESLLMHIRRNGLDGLSVEFAHFAHEDFLQLLMTSALVLTAPGVTTTLEALSVKTPIRFLLPQNDSQALMSEHYRQLLGDDACMAFSRFGNEFTFPQFRTAQESVALSLAHLEAILSTRQSDIRSMIRKLIEMPPVDLARLEHNIANHWETSGQQMIVSDFLCSQNALS